MGQLANRYGFGESGDPKLKVKLPSGPTGTHAEKLERAGSVPGVTLADFAALKASLKDTDGALVEIGDWVEKVQARISSLEGVVAGLLGSGPISVPADGAKSSAAERQKAYRRRKKAGAL